MMNNLHELLVAVLEGCENDIPTDEVAQRIIDALKALVEERDETAAALRKVMEGERYERGRAERAEAEMKAQWDKTIFQRQRAEDAEADLATAREGLKDVLAHLVAAVSVLEHGGKRGVASDKMFKIMLSDYHKSIERGRAIAAARAEGGE